jgi:uncharacterized protein YkwD
MQDRRTKQTLIATLALFTAAMLSQCAQGQVYYIQQPWSYAQPVVTQYTQPTFYYYFTYPAPQYQRYQPVTAQPVVTQPVAAQASSVSPDNYTFVAWLNSMRAAQNLSAVHVDQAMVNDAAMNSQIQASRDRIGHFYNGAVVQNAGWNATGPLLFNMWAGSRPHLANLMHPGLTAVGLAYVHGRSGVYSTFSGR